MIDLSTTIGGRTVTPALPIVDGSPSTAPEIAFNATLEKYIAAHVELEPESGIRTRERVLVRMGKLHRQVFGSEKSIFGVN